jgi:PAS domain S-box-containing protein
MVVVSNDGGRRGRPDRGTDGLFFAVMDAAATPVVLVDPDGQVAEANHAAVEFFGYPREVLLGLPVDDLVGHEHAADHARLRAEYTADPRPRAYRTHDRLRARRRDGSEPWVQASLTPLVTDDGVWVAATVQDLTLRRTEERRLRELTRSSLMLSSLNQAVLRARDTDDLFREVCRVAVDEGDFAGAWVARPTGPATLEVAATGGVMDSWAGRLVDLTEEPASGMPSAVAIRDGVPVFHDDLQTADVAEGVREGAAEQGIHAMLALPLRCRSEVVASLTIYADHAGAFDEALRVLLEDLADNVGYALTSLDSARRLDEVAAHRSELLTRLLDAQEAERARIAADVHDDPVQELAAVDLRLGLIRRRLAGEDSSVLDDLGRVQGMVASVTGGLRELLFELEPGSSDADLLTLVRSAADHVFDGSSTRWSLEHAGGAEKLPPQVRLQALRIVKEALINVRKHARAGTVLIRLEQDPGELRLEIEDDGLGIGSAPPGPGLPGHRGLASMRDRAEVLGGTLEMAGLERGTRVRVRLPLARPGPDPAAAGT